MNSPLLFRGWDLPYVGRLGNLSHEQDNLWPANQMQYKCQTSRCIFSFMHNLLKQRDSTAPKVKMCTLTVTHYTGCGCLHSHAVRCASIGDVFI